MSLHKDLDIPGPHPSIYKHTRQILSQGFMPLQQPDWITNTALTQEQHTAKLLTDGLEELSAISAAVVGGIGQRIDAHNLFVEIEGEEESTIAPMNFQELVEDPDRDRLLFLRLSDAMTTTYSIAVLDNITRFREDPQLITALQRTDALFEIPQDTPGYITGQALEGFIIENLDEASRVQAALLRMIPALAAPIAEGLSIDEKILIYQEIAQNSEKFIRYISAIPSVLSKHIGERMYRENEEDETPGLWDSILLANGDRLANIFGEKLVLLVGVDGKMSVGFSFAFKQELQTIADKAKVTINPKTGVPIIRADGWFTCPGLHTIDGHQVNIDMWRQHVEIAPEIWELQAD